MRTARPIAAALAATLAACATQSSRVVGDDLFAGNRLAARFVHPTYDAAAPRDTCKVWHEVFAPDGRRITKGLGGEFEHHRGLFLGFNQVRCGARRFDFWHCHAGESQRHEGYLAPAAMGLGDGWQVARIAWCDAAGTAIVRERRALRARPLGADATALDVCIELLAADEPVQLGGDPQHSGHQFRALDAFAQKDAPKVTYVRPATAVASPDDVWTDCAWIGAVLPLPTGPVTVVRTEGQDPGPVRWSTRPYGRFGATFAHRLERGERLRLSYCYVVAAGALDADGCARLAAAAATPTR